jgi:hypothetical protein
MVQKLPGGGAGAFKRAVQAHQAGVRQSQQRAAFPSAHQVPDEGAGPQTQGQKHDTTPAFTLEHHVHALSDRVANLEDLHQGAHAHVVTTQSQG